MPSSTTNSFPSLSHCRRHQSPLPSLPLPLSSSHTSSFPSLPHRGRHRFSPLPTTPHLPHPYAKLASSYRHTVPHLRLPSTCRPTPHTHACCLLLIGISPLLPTSIPSDAMAIAADKGITPLFFCWWMVFFVGPHMSAGNILPPISCLFPSQHKPPGQSETCGEKSGG